MAIDSTESLLRSLTAQTGEGSEQIYAKWAGLTVKGGDTLFALVARKLTANAKTAQIKDSLLSTLKAGGAVGETTEECLIKSGLTGWS